MVISRSRTTGTGQSLGPRSGPLLPPMTELGLESALMLPSTSLVSDMAEIDGDLVILGAGGKMGPTLAMLARNALDLAGKSDTKVFAVSRWTDKEAASRLDAKGVTVFRAEVSVETDLSALPDAANVIYMIGAKFGSSSNPGAAWMTNTVLTALVAQRYHNSKLVAFSTGNVYPFTPVSALGSRETDPVGPVGEYAMSCLGRERVIHHVAETAGLHASIVRLNYAVEPRYGVLCDIAQRILSDQPIDLEVGYVNVVWQRYANEVVLRSLLHTAAPPFILNLSGPEIASVRSIATRFGVLLGREPVFIGQEGNAALLTNAAKCHATFGYPDMALDTLIQMQAQWLISGGRVLDRPTKFERADGKF